MHDHIDIIHRNPHGVLLSLDTPNPLAKRLEHLFVDTVSDGGDLRRRIGVADDKVGTDGAVDARQVQRYNILTFFIFDRTDDRVDQNFQFIHKIRLAVCAQFAKIRISESKTKFLLA